MDHRSALHADCSRCQGLCCISLPFDRGEWFGFDKAANVACRYLQPDHRCGIHDELSARGQDGCAVYDCYGAGQRITQELFPGVSWQSEPEARAEVFEAFRRLKRVHELSWLLHEAAQLPLSQIDAVECASLCERLEPTEGLTPSKLDALDLEAVESAVRMLLRRLAPAVAESSRRSLPLLEPRVGASASSSSGCSKSARARR